VLLSCSSSSLVFLGFFSFPASNGGSQLVCFQEEEEEEEEEEGEKRCEL
jgi:hypothetical protein